MKPAGEHIVSGDERNLDEGNDGVSSANCGYVQIVS